MTFDDDMVRIDGKCYPLRKLGLEWPPPPIIDVAGGGRWRRVMYSAITDEERSEMSHVFRGAEYVPAGSDLGTTS